MNEQKADSTVDDASSLPKKPVKETGPKTKAERRALQVNKNPCKFACILCICGVPPQNFVNRV